MRMNKTNYKQYDTRWANLPYPVRPWYIKECGCGEVALANSIIEIVKYKGYTPKTIQPYCKQFAAANGDGTAWSAPPIMMEHYGMTEVKEHQTMASLWKELAKGDRVAIYLMSNRNAGSKGIHWTGSKHFICSVDYRYVNGHHEVYVKDSNSNLDARNGWMSYNGSLRNAVFKVWSGKIPAAKKKKEEPKTSKPTKPFKGDLPKGTVQSGSKGADVKRLKGFLNWYFNAKVLNPDNGNAGSKTAKWIKRFQKDVGIKPIDGIFGAASKAEARRVIKEYDTDSKKSKYYSNRVIIGQASCNESGGLYGGKAGDQAKEVGFANWYNSGWLYVFRAKDKGTRLKLAQAMLDTCRNQHIGYDAQKPDRYTAYDLAEKNGWHISKINKNCETTCSQAVSMCMRAAGIPEKYAPRHMDIAAMMKVMKKDPLFKMYTDRAHTNKSEYLQAGDILLSSHHTVIVVKSPNN